MCYLLCIEKTGRSFVPPLNDCIERDSIEGKERDSLLENMEPSYY